MEVDEEVRRWTFTGDELVETPMASGRPTASYTLGFLCGAVEAVSGVKKVAAVETDCQSMGDELCRILVQAVR